MKKLLCLLLSLLMLSSLLVGCQVDNENTDETSEKTDETSQKNEKTQETDENGNITVILDEDGDPYQLEYTSNGDGTCYVSNIIYNIKYEGKFKLEIPEKSPEGDTVTGIDMSGHFSETDSNTVFCGFPCIMTETIFQRIYAKICETDTKEFYKKKFEAYFNLEDWSEEADFVKLSILTAYPVTRTTTKVYVWDACNTASDAAWIRSYLDKISYTAEEYYNDMQEMKQLLAQTELYTETELTQALSNANYSDYLSKAQTALEEQKKDADRYITNAWNVSEIVLPDTLKEIGDYAFCGCINITSIQIPANVTKIGNYSFLSCKSLTELTIPEGVTEIGDGCFYSCGGTITLPASLVSIGEIISKNYQIESSKELNYNGTVAQFTAVAKSDNWKYYTEEDDDNYTIHCSDGDFVPTLKPAEE